MDRRDSIGLKCELLINGVRLDELRRDLIDQLGWTPERAAKFSPAELRLPGEVYSQVRPNSEANVRLRVKGAAASIEDRAGRELAEALLVQRPPFAGEASSDGTPFDKIVVYNAECTLNFTWNYYCDYFRTGTECRFCNLTPAQDFYPEESISNARKTARQIADVIAAAREHHYDPKAILTRGTPGAKQGLGGTVEIFEEIEARLGRNADGTVAKILLTVSPTRDVADVATLKQLGVHSVAFNFEVFDPGYWKAIVPGKDQNVGRENWEASLVEAVRLFGEGRVFTALIGGLEPRKTLMEGVRWCAERGIVPVVVPFSPETGSQFEGFRPPTWRWMMDTNREAVDVIAGRFPFIATDQYWADDAPICAECFTGGFMFDMIKSDAGLATSHPGYRRCEVPARSPAAHAAPVAYAPGSDPA